MRWHMTNRLLSLAGAVIVPGNTTLAAAETKIQARDLPPAVQKAIPDANMPIKS
jgi:hypothetical protein